MPDVNYSHLLPDLAGDFRQSPRDAYDVLEALIEKHPSIYFLRSFQPFKILFKTKAMLKMGRRVLGQIKLYPERERLVHPYRALIILDWEFWRENPKAHEPVLFHELCHLEETEDGNLKLCPHDVEEFYAVIKNYGDWRNEINAAKECMLAYQMNLFEQVSNRMDADQAGDIITQYKQGDIGDELNLNPVN